MEAVIAKMRADWTVVANSRVESGDWTAADEAEIGAAIRASIDAKDRNAIACWSRWLADLACWVVSWNLICRGSEARMKAAAQEAKELKEKGKK